MLDKANLDNDKCLPITIDSMVEELRKNPSTLVWREHIKANAIRAMKVLPLKDSAEVATTELFSNAIDDAFDKTLVSIAADAFASIISQSIIVMGNNLLDVDRDTFKVVKEDLNTSLIVQDQSVILEAQKTAKTLHDMDFFKGADPDYTDLMPAIRSFYDQANQLITTLKSGIAQFAKNDTAKTLCNLYKLQITKFEAMNEAIKPLLVSESELQYWIKANSQPLIDILYVLTDFIDLSQETFELFAELPAKADNAKAC